MPYTTYLDGKLNKEAFGKTDFVAPTTLYVGLSKTEPTKAGTNVTEPSGGAYARVASTNNTTNWVPSSPQPGDGSQQQENGTAVTFPTATADWGVVTHFVIYDASSSGNLLAYGELDNSRNIFSGDGAAFAAGTIKIKLN